MNYLKFLLYLSFILMFSVYVCIAPPNPSVHGPTNGGSEPGGGKTIPHGGLSYIINVNPSDQDRDRIVKLNFILKNEGSSKIPNFFILGKYEDDYEIVNVSHHNQTTINQNDFSITCLLGPCETKSFTHYLRIKKTASQGPSKILNRTATLRDSYSDDYEVKSVHNGINVGYKKSEVSIEIKKEKSKLNDGIFIRNNKPKIISSYVTVIPNPELHLQSDNGSLLYKYKDEPKPIDIWLNVSGSDVEDEILNYTWLINPIGIEYKINKTSYLLNMLPQKSSLKYSFSVYAEDQDLDKSETIHPNIIHGDDKHSNIKITEAKIGEKIKFYIILIVFLGMLFALALKKWPKDSPFMNRLLDSVDKKRYTLLFVPIVVYSIFIKLASMNVLWHYELPFYLTSLALFEVLIFVEIFIFIILFTHHCFSQQETKNDEITATLWFVNLVGMIIILTSIILVLPLIETIIQIEEHLQWYYSTMAQVFASILAIVAVFYTALPNKNIVSINLKKEQVEYNHPSILHLFIIIYGTILGLALLGLSSGVYIEFPPYIFDSGSLINLTYLTNIFSIFLLETTLLFIPPAISSLYALIRITAFTGTVKIESKPSAARIYLEGYNTRLITPTKLMLRSGEYDLSLMINKNTSCVFKWDEVPGIETELFKEFLKYKFGINWVKTAKVEKIDDGKTIKVYDEKKSVLLRLNDVKNVAILETDDGNSYKFIAETKNDKIYIYYIKQVKLVIIPGTEKEYHLDLFKLEHDNSDNPNICDYLVSSKSFE